MSIKVCRLKHSTRPTIAEIVVFENELLTKGGVLGGGRRWLHLALPVEGVQKLEGLHRGCCSARMLLDVRTAMVQIVPIMWLI